MSGGLVERVVKTSHELVVRVSVEGDDDVLGVDGSEGCTAYLMLCRVKAPFRAEQGTSLETPWRARASCSPISAR